MEIMNNKKVTNALHESHRVAGIRVYTRKGTRLTEERVRQAILSLDKKELQTLKQFYATGQDIIIKEMDATYTTGKIAFFNEEECHLILAIDGKNRVEPGVIAHELTHFDQWVRGDLEVVTEGKGHVVWKGRAYELPLNHKDANDLPWEIEAYQAQFEWLFENGYTQTLPSVQLAAMNKEAVKLDLLTQFREWRKGPDALLVGYALMVLLFALVGFGMVVMINHIDPINAEGAQNWVWVVVAPMLGGWLISAAALIRRGIKMLKG